MSQNYVFGTMVVTAASAAVLREMSRRLDKSECAGMFTSPLCRSVFDTQGNNITPVGAPITNYISSGWVPQVYAQTLNDPVLLYTRAKKVWEADGDVFPYTQTQVTNQWNQADITNGTILVNGVRVPESPFSAMARLGLEPARVAL